MLLHYSGKALHKKINCGIVSTQSMMRKTLQL